MTWRGKLWLVIACLAIAVSAILIPGSPVYLPTLIFQAGRYQGFPAGHWAKQLNDPDTKNRRIAIHALGALGTESAAAIPALAIILTDDPDRDLRNEASLALSKMVPASREAVPALAKALSDPELQIRLNAALALLRLRADAKPAVPELLKALEDVKNQQQLGTFAVTCQEMVALALGAATAGTSDAVPALMKALEGASTDGMQRSTTNALASIGEPARPAAPLLRKLLKDENRAVRVAAKEALEKIGEDSTEEKTPTQPKQKAPEFELPEDERAYLWEIEHHGNLLTKHGLSALCTALKNADSSALSQLLNANFSGTDLRQPERIRRVTDFAEVERLQDAGLSPLPLTREAFVARLLELRKLFADKSPQVRASLMTLSPKIRGQLEGAWEGTAQVRMHGEHAKGAPAEVVFTLRYEIAQPSEKMLAGPGWLRSAGIVQVANARAPQYLFAEVGKQRGLEASRLYDNWNESAFRPSTGGVHVCDFNRDGILDLLVTDITGHTLYRGRLDGTFEDVTSSLGLPRHSFDRVTAVWIDMDGDGWEDLILAGHIYRNEGGQHFTDYTDRSKLYLPADAGNIVVADYDGDGKLDLYITRSGRPGKLSWLDGKSSEKKGNLLLRNLGNWAFEDVTAASGTSGGQRSTFTAAWLDVNNDGRPDLHVINEFGDGVLLVNNGNGTFSEHALSDRPADFGTMGMAVGDINNDGNIDIYCANMYSKAGTRVIGNLAPSAYPPDVMERMRRFVAGSQLHLNQGNLKFDQVARKMQVAAVGWAYGTCLADLDNDGFLDIYATAGFISRSREDPDG